MQHAPIHDPARNRIQQLGMGDVPEVVREVSGLTGRLARPGDRGVILEAFKPGTVPTGTSEIVDGVSVGPRTTGTGGLY